MKNKILTIAIPAYQVEQYIDKTLNSIKKVNKLEKLEVLIIDDGSIDKTADIANRYQMEFPTVFHLIQKTNGGHGSAINTGIKNATGKYFKIIDGDDWVNPEALDRMIDSLEIIEEDLILSDFNECYMNCRKIRRISYPFPKNRKILAKELNYHELIPMHSYIYKTKVLLKLPKLMDEKCFYVDMEYILYPLLYVETIRYLPICIYQYRLERENQSVSKEGFQKHYKDHERVLLSLFQYYNTYFYNNEKVPLVNYVEERVYDMWYRHILKCCWFLESRQLKQQNEKVQKISKYLHSFDKELKNNVPKLYQGHNQLGRKWYSLSTIQLSILRLTNYRIWPIVKCKKEIGRAWKKIKKV